MFLLLKATRRALGALGKAAGLYTRVRRTKRALRRRFSHTKHPKKESEITMKKSSLIAVIAALAAIAGALVAVALYLRRREKELDEYERLLFGEDEAAPAASAPAEEPAPAAEEPAAAPEESGE